MKNLKIALKFALSFGGLLLLLAVVALWSVFGIRGIVGDAEEVIDGNKLRGNMVQKEVDHLNWANKVNALLVNKDITELDVQIDPHKCAFGEWLYGEGRQQAETSIPALKSILAKIEKPHSDLHLSAEKIGKVFTQADPELPAILEARIIDHLNWADRFRDTFLGNKEELHVQIDPTKCGLGKWLHSKEAKEIYKNAGPEFRELWDEMVPVHAKLHESAVPVVNAYAQINPGLKEKLLRRLLDHKTWAEKVSHGIIAGNADLGVQTDHTKCAYGKFLDSQELADMMSKLPALRTAIEQSKEPHKRLHESAIAIASALQKGNKTEAVNIFTRTQKALDEVEASLKQAIQAEDTLDTAQHAALMLFEDKTVPLLHETMELLEGMEKEAEHELRGMHEANTIFATQTKPNLHSVQELLAEARHTVDEYMMTDEAMIAAASKINMAVIVISVIALGVGLMLAFFMSRSITVPLAATVDMIKEMSKGHLTRRLQLNRGDELGEMADAMDNFSDDLEKDTVGALTKLANGDLTFDATPKDDADAIGN
ncbi:MAG: HAMP domain-containing protein, partial [Desulforhopalus sp.]|nr:HAMP domain-containing protein [Desulforhopalus sp.]